MNRTTLDRKNNTHIYIENELFNSSLAGYIFSGEHYSIRNPLLYYTRNALFESKTDYYGFDFLYTSNKSYLESTAEQKKETISEDISIVLTYLKKISESYNKIILVSKSNGLCHVENIMKEPTLKQKIEKLILFSPGNTWNDFIPILIESKIRTLIVFGSKDRMHFVNNTKLLDGQSKIQEIEIENADHSIEVDNNEIDIENIKRIMKVIRNFLIE